MKNKLLIAIIISVSYNIYKKKRNHLSLMLFKLEIVRQRVKDFIAIGDKNLLIFLEQKLIYHGYF